MSNMPAKNAAIPASMKTERDAAVFVKEQEKQKYIAGAKILLANPGQAVAQVYELLEENGTVYTIMEYVEGISLDAYLTQNKNRFPVERIR